MARPSVGQVPWMSPLLPVLRDTCHPFLSFLTVWRELNYIVLDPLPLSPPFLSLLNQVSVVTAPLSTKENYKYAWNFPRGKMGIYLFNAGEA